MVRLLHASDLHFGAPSISEQVVALEAVIARETVNAFVLSGDLSQRSRAIEFTRGREFLHYVERHAPAMIVPGNHDVAWWMDPMGLGSHRAMYTRYRRLIRDDLEPILHLPGLTIVGLNSAHGIQPYSLTLRPRDLSVVGSVRPEQWSRARAAFDGAPANDFKVLVVHHNLLRGRLSGRWGLVSRARGVEYAAATGAELVLCGHDHEERVERVRHANGTFVVASASTLTDRVRGGGPSSINLIEADAATITVSVMEWNAASAHFALARVERFPRETRA